jgi:hypothetical protein
MGVLDTIKRWFGQTEREAERVVGGDEPDATPPAGSVGQPERETSTNAQTQGARDEPGPGNG